MKKVTGMIKLQCKGGQASPAPPIGPALGSKGVNIMDFCKQFNARTQKEQGTIIPVVITVFSDRSFSFELKTPPASVLLKKAAGLEKGSAEPNKNKVANLSPDQVSEIAQTKLPDLNTVHVDAAARSISGTARSMGITVS